MVKLMIIKMITMYSLAYNIDPKIALSVVAVESGFNPNVIGITGDVGLFQLNPKSFPNYSIKQLKDPTLNIELGIKYLAKMKKECKYKDNNEWLVCYNYGIKNTKKVKHPELFPYVKKVKLAMNERNF
jgi:soluble lytic murein transglycosylase-like protein